MNRNRTVPPALRDRIRTSEKSVRALAAELGLNPKTVAKWKRRPSSVSAPPGRPRGSRSALTPAEEAMCVGFRKHALLPLDDCLYALQIQFPHLSRATLHRIFRKHGIGQLPRLDTGRAPLGEFYLDSSAVRTGEGLAAMFFAFDRHSRLGFADLYPAPTENAAASFLSGLLEFVPYRVRGVLASDRPQFSGRSGPFAALCRSQGVARSFIPANDLWSVAAPRPDETPAPARLAQPYYRDHGHLRAHFRAFFDDYNFSRRLKTLGGRTPYGYVCSLWETAPSLFTHRPQDRVPHLNAPHLTML